MTVLIVLAGLVLSHYFTVVGRWRDFAWLLWPFDQVRQHFPGRPVLALLALIFGVVLVSFLAVGLMTALLGIVGWSLLALVVFIYTLGPRDLDHDVRYILDDPLHADGREAARALGLAGQADAGAAAAAVLHAARTRWFAILFWFVVLGIPGALLYRACQQAMQSDSLDERTLDWLARMRWVMEWPVLVIMTLSTGLVADLDPVVQAWKRYHRTRPWWLFSPLLLDQVAETLVAPDASREDGLRKGHQLAWRILVLWLVVMSLMLIAGWMV